MKLRIDREESQLPQGAKKWVTFGDLYIDRHYECCTLEDKVREVAGQDVAEWKVPEETAIGQGVYELELQDSPKFGKNTPTILRVPGFKLIRVHGGVTVDDTEGCPLVGSRQDRINGTLHGAKVAQRLGDVIVSPVYPIIQAKLSAAIVRGERIWIQVRNAPSWYAQYGLPYPEEELAWPFRSQ